MTTSSNQMDRAAKELLVKLYFQGEPYPELAIAELHTPEACVGLEFWYATQRAGAHSRPPVELIGTRAALDFIANYSDMSSPAHDIALREMARALGREAALEAIGARGGGQ